jgi:hypothetical protein
LIPPFGGRRQVAGGSAAIGSIPLTTEITPAIFDCNV